MAEPITLQTLLTYLTLISVPVGVFYYITTLRNQNRARQAQLLMQMHMYRTNELRSYNVRVMDVISKKISGFLEYKEKMENDENFEKVNLCLFNFNEALGVFVNAGYFDIRNVALMWAGVTRIYYENIFEPMIDEARVFYNFQRLGSESEYLCKTLIKYMEEHPELKT